MSRSIFDRWDEDDPNRLFLVSELSDGTVLDPPLPMDEAAALEEKLARQRAARGQADPQSPPPAEPA